MCQESLSQRKHWRTADNGGMGMSYCKVCHLDIKKHSKKLWALHQQAQICTLCQKNASEHSEKLWEIDNLILPRQLLEKLIVNKEIINF